MKDKAKNQDNVQKSDKPELYNQENPNRSAVWIAIALMVVLMAGAGGAVYYLFKQNKQEISSLERENNILVKQMIASDSLINAWVRSMLAIEKDLQELQGKEESLISKSSDTELTPDIRESIRSEIKDINRMLEENKERIRNLTEKLRNSGASITALNEKVSALEYQLMKRDSSMKVLKQELTDRDFRISEMNEVVDSLNDDIVQYAQDIEKYEDTLQSKINELNKAFIARGTLDELEELGIISREGGFLGLGKSKTIRPDLTEEPFERVQITDTRKIALNAKKVNLISEHPTSSYEIIANDSAIGYLEIKDPNEFWKITKYAVVETKN